MRRSPAQATVVVMRRVILVLLAVGLGGLDWAACGPSAPAVTPPSRVAARPETPRRVPRRARVPPPRPRGWVAEAVGRVRAAPGPTAQVIALGAAGTRLVTAERPTRNGAATLSGWDPATRKRLWQLKAPGRPVDLQLAADGRFLLVTSALGTNWVYRIDGARPKLYRRWKRKAGSTQGLSAGGQLLIRGDVRGQVRGYALEKYKMKWLTKADRVVVSRDGRVAACVKGRELTLRDARSGRAMGKPRQWTGVLLALDLLSATRWAALLQQGKSCALVVASQPRRSVDCLPSARLVWSPGGKRLALHGKGGVTIWGADNRGADNRVLVRLRSSGSLLVAFLSDDRFVVANQRAGELTHYRLVRR